MSNLELIHALEGAVEASPENLALRKHLANLVLEEGLYAEAVSHFRRALDLAPQDGELKYALARAYAGQGKQDVALVVLEDLMRAGVPSSAALVMAARMYCDSGHGGEAARAYARARLAAGFTPDPELETRLGTLPVESAGRAQPEEKPVPVEWARPAENLAQEDEREKRVPVYLTGEGDGADRLQPAKPRTTSSMAPATAGVLPRWRRTSA